MYILGNDGCCVNIEYNMNIYPKQINIVTSIIIMHDD